MNVTIKNDGYLSLQKRSMGKLEPGAPTDSRRIGAKKKWREKLKEETESEKKIKTCVSK